MTDEKTDSVVGDTKQTAPITELPASELLRLARIDDPQEHGEAFDRFTVMDEIERRGLPLLTALDWPADLEAKYKNRWTGCEHRLGVILAAYNMAADLDDLEAMTTPDILAAHDAHLQQWRPSENNLAHTLHVVLEHWLPIEQWTPSELLPEAEDHTEKPKRKRQVKPMSELKTSDAAKEYQDAVRELDELQHQPDASSDELERAHQRLQNATTAWEAEKAAARPTTTSELTEAIAASSHDTTTAEQPTELEIVKQQLKAAGQTLRGLRARNKELHQELQQNIAEKKRLNYEVIPKLREQKKALTGAHDASDV